MPERVRPPLVGFLAVAALCGCGMTQGRLLYFMGAWKGPKIEAEFKMTAKGAVVILVDDFEERLDSPRTRTELAEQLGAELEAHRAVGSIIPQSKLDALRRKDPDFDRSSGRRIGERVGAEQVLYVAVRDFYASPEPSEATDAARMSVAVKVLNVLEKESRRKVRLWPTQPNGHLLTVGIDAATVVRVETPEAISKELTLLLADKIAKLFYDHHLADVESP